MDDLQKARQKISEINKQMALLFEERMMASRLVAKYKKEHGLPIFDPRREKEILENDVNYIKDSEIRPYYKTVLKCLMNTSKSYQFSIIKGQRVSYSGVEGAFAQIAANRVFPGAHLVPFSSFRSAYNAVMNMESDCAVLPIENSYAGEVGQVMDLMYEGDLFVNGVYELKIGQNLLGLKDAEITDIKTVVSHPQALSQCDEYIKKHGFAEETASNTAVAAKQVKEKNDKSVGAIASAETAEHLGLKILDHNINSSAVNTTRFAVFTRVDNPSVNDKDRNFILIFTVNHIPGALSKAINVISSYGYNMKSMHSRPIKEKAWEYYFYVEAEGDETSQNGKEMLKELKKHCNMLKTVGHFGKEKELVKDGKTE